jgi:gag-polypeptide of LTR copia-type
MAQPPKHDIHKFRDIRPKLGRDNWVSWKRDLLATARDRGLYATIAGSDVKPTEHDTSITIVGGVMHIGSVPLTEKIAEWEDRNNAAYNQILLCISSDQQTAIDETDVASRAWTIWTNRFESKDPSKIAIVRTRYDNYHMLEGQPVNSYLTTMKEFRNQLAKMGEVIPDSTHASIILRNVPESWISMAQTIRMVYEDLNQIETKLEAYEAHLDLFDTSTQVMGQPSTAFTAQFRAQDQNRNRDTKPLTDYRSSGSKFAPSRFNKSMHNCVNCGKQGHSAARCFAPGGGRQGQASWNNQFESNTPERWMETGHAQARGQILCLVGISFSRWSPMA